jgi:hypothetical protein
VRADFLEWEGDRQWRSFISDVEIVVPYRVVQYGKRVILQTISEEIRSRIRVTAMFQENKPHKYFRNVHSGINLVLLYCLGEIR